MKSMHWFLVAMVTFASLPLMAQAGGTQQTVPAAGGPATAAEVGEPQISAYDLARAAAYLRPVSAVWEG